MKTSPEIENQLDFTKTYRVLIINNRLALYFCPPFSRIKKWVYRFFGIVGKGAFLISAAKGYRVSICRDGLDIRPEQDNRHD